MSWIFKALGRQVNSICRNKYQVMCEKRKVNLNRLEIIVMFRQYTGCTFSEVMDAMDLWIVRHGG